MRRCKSTTKGRFLRFLSQVRSTTNRTPQVETFYTPYGGKFGIFLTSRLKRGRLENHCTPTVSHKHSSSTRLLRHLSSTAPPALFLSVALKVALRVTLDPLHLARVKLARAECLTAAGFPAEAASALAAVLTGGNTPTTIGEYAGRRCVRMTQGGMKTHFSIHFLGTWAIFSLKPGEGAGWGWGWVEGLIPNYCAVGLRNDSSFPVTVPLKRKGTWCWLPHKVLVLFVSLRPDRHSGGLH